MDQLDLLGTVNENNDISCIVIKRILAFCTKSHDSELLRNLLEQTGLDPLFLENEDNWISYEQYLVFLEKLTEITANPHIAFESGVNLLSASPFDFLYFLMSILKAFGVPKEAYQRIIEYRSLFSHVDNLEILSQSGNQVRIKYTLGRGLKAHALNCDVIKGQLAAVPKFWKLPTARVKELQCQAQGAECCIFEITWRNGFIQRMLPGIGIAVFLGAGVLFFLLFKQSLLTFKDIFISGLVSALGFMIFLFLEYRFKFISRKDAIKKRAKTLETAIIESRLKYQELARANQQIIEKANKLSLLNKISSELIKTNVEDVLVKDVLKLMVENMDFDVGFCLFMDNNQNLIKKPLVCTKALAVEDLQMSLDNFFIKKGIADIFTQKRPQIVDSEFLFKNARKKEILAIPLGIQNYFFYLLLFYNYSPENRIDRKNLDFFDTISYQLEISLDNIYAAKAAKAIIAGLPSSLLLFDAYSLKISYINPSCCRAMGVTMDKALGKNIVSFLKIADPLVQKSFHDLIGQAVQSRIVDDQELKTGREIIGFTLFKMPALFGSGDEVGMIMKNITGQKEMKEQLFRAEKLAALGTLVSGIAHEINNPLYGILGMAEIIMDETKETFVKNYAREMIDFVTQAADIVKDLSSYSRGIREDKPALLDINLVLDDALRIVKYSKNFMDITVKKKYTQVAPFLAQAGELRQIYINLLNNAIEAMEGKGTITLQSKNGRQAVETQIADTGSGIAEEILPKIFDPFFTTKEASRGTGLGLHIVYRLVTQNNGVISVQSTRGKGTTFKIKYFLNKETGGVKGE